MTCIVLLYATCKKLDRIDLVPIDNPVIGPLRFGAFVRYFDHPLKNLINKLYL